MSNTSDLTLRDGVHFSLDGKKLLKYKEEAGQTVYAVPAGTKEICAEAFFRTTLREIRLPESVTTIRNGAFTTQGGKPLFVKLPSELKKLPADAFRGGFFDGDDDREGADWQKYYYISTSNKEFIPLLCCESYSKGSRCPIYLGGKLDDLNPREKPYAVKGFLYALKTGVEDMSPWRDSYLDHIRRNEATYIKQAEEDEFLLHLMIDEKRLSEKGTKVLLEAFEKRSSPMLTAALLAYQSAQFGDVKDELSLSDDDPKLKRMLKMQARQEQIRDQKGIAGLAFVATGDLEQFGYVDEYTGAHDLSDLKEYIEQRGGYLRNAVSSKTDYLICNDPNSESVKSKKAKELGVPVISEEAFLKMSGEPAVSQQSAGKKALILQSSFVLENSILIKYVGPGGDVVVPEEVTSIGEWAFSNCNSLTSVAIPAGVTSIGKKAFSNCSSLTSVAIPAGVTSIGDSAFILCKNLKSVTLPEGVTSIGSMAFNECTSLASVTIPDSVTTIGDGAFENVGKTMFHTTERVLKLIHRKDFIIKKGVLEKYCGPGGDIVIPNSVTKIGWNAFNSCTNLSSVRIPDSVSLIDNCAFHTCTGLSSITIPESVTRIGKWAFRDCFGLKSVTIQGSVTSIGEWAFDGCKSLSSVTFTGSVTRIDKEAFRKCKSLNSVVFASGVKTLTPDTFADCKKLTIHAPAGSFAERYAKKNNIRFTTD